MSDNCQEHGVREFGHPANRLPYHIRRDSRLKDSTSDKTPTLTHIDTQSLSPTFGQRRRFPESLHFTPSSFRLRSRTASTRSSISSANVPDSATTCSHSTLASPISTSYTSDISDVFSNPCADTSRPGSRVFHRHKHSTGTCSTFVNDEEDPSISAGYSDLSAKIGEIQVCTPVPTEEDGQLTPCTSPSDEAQSIKEEQSELTPSDSRQWLEPEFAADPPQWETSSNSSEDFSSQDAEAILDYTLQLAYGVDLHEASQTTPALRRLVCKFVGDIGSCVWASPGDAEVTQAMSTSSNSSTPSQGGSASGFQGGGKRKKLTRGDDDEGEFSDGDGSGFMPIKRAKPSPKDDENLRLSCPFRKRNPQRFNVRDHHSCAMTYFPKFAELRQHIVKQHKRDDPSAFVCDRCNCDFRTRKELREHQRLPKELMCDISDHNPESGVDGTTSNKLLSRKRVSGTTPEAQWREIWGILFPDDDDNQVQPYYFTPVIEHFELSSYYLHSLSTLSTSLRDKISNPATLETLSSTFQQCFMEAVERCIVSAQTMPYTNRSNKRNEPARVQSLPAVVPRKGKDILPRPDSGVVMMDEGSEESFSTRNSTGIGPRDSVRTVVRNSVPRRGSNLAPDIMPENLPTTTPTPAPSSTFDPDFMAQLAIMPTMNVVAPMDPAAVHDWNNSVLFHNDAQINSSFTKTHQFNPEEDLSRQGELAPNWGAGFYEDTIHGMGQQFQGFSGS